MTHCFSRRSFLKGSAAAAAALTSPLLPTDAAFSETENGLFSPVSALCQTQYGPVKGREGENGQLCWYGIPYGAAPTGESRWTAPQEPSRWQTVRDCTSPAPAAYQYTTFPLGTEDCLTLDIYSSAEAKKRPVLVYLHAFKLVIGLSYDICKVFAFKTHLEHIFFFEAEFVLNVVYNLWCSCCCQS